MQHDNILKPDLLSEVLVISSGALIFLLLMAFLALAIASSLFS